MHEQCSPWHVDPVRGALFELAVPAQAYDRWLRGDHAHLFIINNDVLVPSGVLTQLMRAMRRGGAPHGA